MSPEAVRQAFEGRPVWSFWWLVPDGLLRPAWVACLVVLALFTVGLWSRVTAVLAWVIVVSTARRAPAALYGFDQINLDLAALPGRHGRERPGGLARPVPRPVPAAPPRAAPRRRNRASWTPSPGVPEPSVSANLALRLIQCHLVFIYCDGGPRQVPGAGLVDGQRFWGIAAAGEFRLFDLTWLAAYPTADPALHPRRTGARAGLPGPGLGPADPPLDAGADRPDARRDRPDPGPDRVQPGDDRGEPRLLSTAAGCGASSRAGTRENRRAGPV